MYVLILFLVLFGMWFVFSGFTGAFFLFSGLFSSLIAIWVGQRMQLVEESRKPLYLQPRLFPYCGWLVKEIIVSGLQVMRLVWQVQPHISPALAWIKALPKTDEGQALYANSITLTPGTVCLDIDKNRVCVHALEQSGIEALKNGMMDKRVQVVSGETK